MLWFRHFSAAGRDEKLLAVKDEFGMEGYGVYWSILEVIADQMTHENNQYFVDLSIKNWRKITEFSPKKLQKYLTFLSEISLFSVEFRQNSIMVSCPKMLKFRDEYTLKKSRKSGQNPDNDRNPSVSVSVSDSFTSIYNTSTLSAREENDSYVDPETGEVFPIS